MSVNLQFAFTIKNIVEFALPCFSKDKGLLISFKIRYSYYDNKDDEKDRDVRKFVYMIFHRPNNYTRVFSVVSDNPIWQNDLIKQKWHLESDHDSCWSSDGFNFIKILKDKIIGEFKNNGIEYRNINELVWIDDIKHLEFDKYIYHGYNQEGIQLNFKF